MPGRRRSRPALVGAAALGLLLIVSLSSASSGAGGQRIRGASVAVPSTATPRGETDDPSRDDREQPTAGDLPSTSTSGTSSSSWPGSTTSASVPARANSADTATQRTAQTTKTPPPKSTTVPPATSTMPPALAGWNLDWSDNFTTPLERTQWSRYGWGGQAPGQGGMGLYEQSNAFTSNGILTLRTQYRNGAWSSAGLSSGDFYSASGGRWELRAKFPVAKGIGYVFLLWPSDGTWPPEIDLAEGRVNGPQVMSTYHWGSNDNRDSQFVTNSTMNSWHTYGVIISASTITYTLDGTPWVTITNGQVTTKKLWVGFQCAAMDPNGSAGQYEAVDDGVPGPLTPAVSDIQIDWVAHYAAA